MNNKLCVNKLDYTGGALLSLGLYELLHYLVDSGVFDVSWHN